MKIAALAAALCAAVFVSQAEARARHVAHQCAGMRGNNACECVGQPAVSLPLGCRREVEP